MQKVKGMDRRSELSSPLANEAFENSGDGRDTLAEWSITSPFQRAFESELVYPSAAAGDGGSETRISKSVRRERLETQRSSPHKPASTLAWKTGSGGNGDDAVIMRSEPETGQYGIIRTLPSETRETPLAPVSVPPLNESQLKEWIERALEGAHVIGSVAEVVEIFHASTVWPAIGASLSWGDSALLAGAAAAGEGGALALLGAIAAPVGYVALIATTILALHEAFSTGTRIQKKKGYCYGIMWGALNMKPVSRTFQPWGGDTADDLHEAWNEGVEKGQTAFRTNVKLHNEVLLRIAYEQLTQNLHGWTRPEGRVLNLLWEQVRGDDLPDTHLGWMIFDPLGAEYDEKGDRDLYGRDLPARSSPQVRKEMAADTDAMVFEPEWAMEWRGEEEGEDPPADAGAIGDAGQDQNAPPPLTQAISDAVEQQNWPRVLELAIKVGWHDENRLTNLLFYARHPELGRRLLNPRANKGDQTLAAEWTTILRTEVGLAIEVAAEDKNLQVSGHYVVERDPQFSGANGEKFTAVVAWAAEKVGLDPGFLAAVLLAEVGSAAPYLGSSEVWSFFIGTDDFYEERARLRQFVPAFADVHFDESKKTHNVNEHWRNVLSVPFRTGRDAVLATAVYLKYGEIKLRAGARKNGQDFDSFPVAVRFVLTRIAMAAGHGGITTDGDFIRFKKVGGKFVAMRAGEAGGILLGVAASLDRVLKGEDILVRNWEPRKDPTYDSHITHRNATILAAQAIHLDNWFFHAPVLGVQPGLGGGRGQSGSGNELEAEFGAT